MLRAALLLQTVQAANYFPGIAPASYSPEQKLPLYVNKLTSTHTQIPYDYYSLPFCHPKIKVYGKGIGSNLEGDRIENSLYKLSVLKNKPCSIVCRKKVTKIMMITKIMMKKVMMTMMITKGMKRVKRN